MKLVALSLLLFLPFSAGAADGPESRTLRPLEIDLRRLYPRLDPRRERIEAGGYRRTGARYRPAFGFLAVCDSAGRAAMRFPPPAVLDASGRERAAAWTVKGGAKGRYTVELGFDPAGLVYPVLVR